MWNQEALPIEIQADDHAQQQFGCQLRIVMPQQTPAHGLLQPTGYALLHRGNQRSVQRTHLVRVLAGLGGHQAGGADGARLRQHGQVVAREADQARAQVAGIGLAGQAGGMALVLAEHLHHQGVLGPVARVQGLLGAAGARGHRIHADLDAVFAQQFVHRFVHLAMPGGIGGTGGWGGGCLHGAGLYRPVH